jgi:hypothetical protein
MPPFPIQISKITYPRLKPHRWCDNGMLVQAYLQRHLRGRLNQVLRWRPKCVFRYVGQCDSIAASGGAGQRDRWRHMFHTGTHTDKIGVYFLMAMQRVGAGDPYAQFQIVGGSSLTCHYGNSGSGTITDYPSTWGHSLQLLDVNPDTDYQAVWSDFAEARLISGLVFELTLNSFVENNYLGRDVAALTPIQDIHRETPYPLATNAWKRNAAQSFTFTVDKDADARTRTSTTDINLVDNSSTAISSSTPGYVLDFRYKNRLSKTVVPTTFWAYGKTAGGGTGHVYLKDSGGAVLATLNINSAANAFYSTTWNAPTTEAKYDLHFDGDGVNLTTVYAAGVYEYA